MSAASRRADSDTRGAVCCSGAVIARMPSTPTTPSTIAARTDGKSASSTSPEVAETAGRTALAARCSRAAERGSSRVRVWSSSVTSWHPRCDVIRSSRTGFSDRRMTSPTAPIRNASAKRPISAIAATCRASSPSVARSHARSSPAPRTISLICDCRSARGCARRSIPLILPRGSDIQAPKIPDLRPKRTSECETSLIPSPPPGCAASQRRTGTVPPPDWAPTSASSATLRDAPPASFNTVP